MTIKLRFVLHWGTGTRCTTAVQVRDQFTADDGSSTNARGPKCHSVAALMHMCSFDPLGSLRVLKTHTAEFVQWLAQGFVMERTVLAEALRASGGLCPLSGRLLITWFLSKHGRMSNLVAGAFLAVLHKVLSCGMVTLRRIGKKCLNCSYVTFLDTYFNKALLVNVRVAIRNPPKIRIVI